MSVSILDASTFTAPPITPCIGFSLENTVFMIKPIAKLVFSVDGIILVLLICLMSIA